MAKTTKPKTATPEPLGDDERYPSRDFIFLKGVRVHNLKNFDLAIPRNRLVVVTGVSGSGKSSLTMDTLYAEGQRRYVESLSSYARQFLGRMKKPDVDYIRGVCPAIAIEQKVSGGNNRSTVGSMTEAYDFMRLLFARVGKTYSPVSGALVRRHVVADVVDAIVTMPEQTRVWLYIPLPVRYQDRTLGQELQLLMQKGFTRLWFADEVRDIEDFLATDLVDFMQPISAFTGQDIRVLIDRFVVAADNADNAKRIADSIQTAFYESGGECILAIDNKETRAFNNRFELDGIEFLDPTPQLFNYNNSYGACRKCEGYGKTIGVDEEKVIPNKTLSVYDGAIACWRGERSSEWQDPLIRNAHKFDFPVHTPYQDLTKAQRKLLWTGNKYFEGLTKYFDMLEATLYKIQNRIMLARFRGRTTCPSCEGGRLRTEALYVKVGGATIADLIDLPMDELLVFFNNLKISEFDRTIGKRLLLEITNRLEFMTNVGLGYLTLNRVANTLSGGETQRINLTRTLGSNLTSSMYILDEPSVGLHPRDSARLVGVLKSLRDLGNTVVVVEHEEDIIAAADYLIDIGPAAGVHGGHLVFAGPYERIHTEAFDSLTANYMSGRMTIPIPSVRRKWSNRIVIKGARQHNLQNIDVTFPLRTLTVVTGVSGSGKTTLVKQLLYPALLKELNAEDAAQTGNFDSIQGDLKMIKSVEIINQAPIGKSSRSNPVTYVKAYDDIRTLMSEQPLAKMRGLKPGVFSFNVEGGRCETCKGDGEQIIEMQFLADVHLECEDCKGRRFKQEILDIKYKDKNIFDILEMTVDESLVFFEDKKSIVMAIRPLADVGLGYVRLGQSSSTLSGGEAQRVKLASYLGKEGSNQHVFFIFDEPTTGLHFHDILKLLAALNALVERGHSVLVVEHNMEVIKSADWVIDLGPDGGKNGGKLLYEGTPEGLANIEGSFTAQFLRDKL